MTLRAFGPYNGTLPVPTKVVVGFMRDPAKMPFLRYAQYQPDTDIQFSYWRLDPDDAVRLVDTNSFAWGYDDYRPNGAGYNPRAELIADRIQRWDFPYRIGQETINTWQKSGISPQQLLDRTRMNHAMLHRAVRCATALTGYSWPAASTATPQGLLGLSALTYFNASSGQEFIGGVPNPAFQIIKRTFQAVKRRLHLQTNGAITGEEMIAILPVSVAQVMATSGEMFEALKQSQFAGELMNPNLTDWGLPASYGGFKLVVEDTPRCFINQKASGVVADITVASEKDYIIADDTIRFVARPGGLDGSATGAEGKTYSTLSCFIKGGEATVEAFQETKHKLVEGHIVLEDKVVVTAPTSGFALTDVLAP